MFSQIPIGQRALTPAEERARDVEWRSRVEEGQAQMYRDALREMAVATGQIVQYLPELRQAVREMEAYKAKLEGWIRRVA